MQADEGAAASLSGARALHYGVSVLRHELATPPRPRNGRRGVDAAMFESRNANRETTLPGYDKVSFAWIGWEFSGVAAQGGVV